MGKNSRFSNFVIAVLTSLLISNTSFSQEVLPNGSFNYNIPIELPPGTGGMKIALALKYNSSGGNGWVGKGFSLAGFPVITRDPTFSINSSFAVHFEQ